MSNLIRDLILSAGKIIIFLGSLATLLLAIGYMVLPELLKALNKWIDQLFNAEGLVMKNRQVVGAAFLVITVVLFLALAMIR